MPKSAIGAIRIADTVVRVVELDAGVLAGYLGVIERDLVVCAHVRRSWRVFVGITERLGLVRRQDLDTVLSCAKASESGLNSSRIEGPRGSIRLCWYWVNRLTAACKVAGRGGLLASSWKLTLLMLLKEQQR